jgi:hypothetical protein
VIVLHLSSWRSEEEARAFALALEETSRVRHDTVSDHRTGLHGESWCLRPGTSPEGIRVYVERWGDLVLYIEGSPSDLDTDGRELNPLTFFARDAAWQTLQRFDFEEVLRQREAELVREAELAEESAPEDEEVETEEQDEELAPQ